MHTKVNEIFVFSKILEIFELIMLGFPYSYGDELTSLEAEQNRKLFFNKHGSIIIIIKPCFICYYKTC